MPLVEAGSAPAPVELPAARLTRAEAALEAVVLRMTGALRSRVPDAPASGPPDSLDDALALLDRVRVADAAEIRNWLLTTKAALATPCAVGHTDSHLLGQAHFLSELCRQGCRYLAVIEPRQPTGPRCVDLVR
jgi:hypothetical protein